MKIWIIEDEPIALSRLTKMLEKINNSIEIVFTTDSVQELLFALKNLPEPEAIFSDIQLSDGLSFSAFQEKIPKCPIVFTTAYDEFAIQAFDYNSVHYLLKPLDENGIKKALEKIKNIQFTGSADLENVLQKYLEKKQKRNKFLFKIGNKYIPINISEIALFWSHDKATYAITFGNQKYLCDETLDALEQQLNTSDFFRANRQSIIHKNSIKFLHQSINGKLKIELNTSFTEELIVSREKASELKNWIDNGE